MRQRGGTWPPLSAFLPLMVVSVCSDMEAHQDFGKILRNVPASESNVM